MVFNGKNLASLMVLLNIAIHVVNRQTSLGTSAAAAARFLSLLGDVLSVTLAVYSHQLAVSWLQLDTVKPCSKEEQICHGGARQVVGAWSR